MSLEARIVGLVEDDRIMGESIVQRLSLEGLTVRWWQCGQDALREMPDSGVEAVVCDIRLPDLGGEDIFQTSARSANAPPFVFITGHGDIDQAVRLMRAGAADYVLKPFDIADLISKISDLMGPRTESGGLPSLGMAPRMKDIERLLTRVGKLRSTVLITGETGSGKEVAARFLHTCSGADRAFMAVNCAAIPADLLESELFGHEKGAFTGASQRHLGYAERSGEGVLFLDEIGELRPQLQAKLLRLIEEQAFHRVGGEKSIPFRGRLVVATNADLQSMVKDGRFREDLFYRINVVSVDVPPLRERRQDIPMLMDLFFTEFAARSDTNLKGVSSLAQEAALSHAWPGNIRELRNRMERAVALSLGQWVMPGDMFPEAGLSAGSSEMQMGSLEDVRSDAEKRHILRALAVTRGEVGAASRLLGIGRTTLWEKMKRLDLKGSDLDVTL